MFSAVAAVNAQPVLSNENSETEDGLDAYAVLRKSGSALESAFRSTARMPHSKVSLNPTLQIDHHQYWYVKCSTSVTRMIASDKHLSAVRSLLAQPNPDDLVVSHLSTDLLNELVSADVLHPAVGPIENEKLVVDKSDISHVFSRIGDIHDYCVNTYTRSTYQNDMKTEMRSVIDDVREYLSYSFDLSPDYVAFKRFFEDNFVNGPVSLAVIAISLPADWADLSEPKIGALSSLDVDTEFFASVESVGIGKPVDLKPILNGRVAISEHYSSALLSFGSDPSGHFSGHLKSSLEGCGLEFIGRFWGDTNDIDEKIVDLAERFRTRNEAYDIVEVHYCPNGSTYSITNKRPIFDKVLSFGWVHSEQSNQINMNDIFAFSEGGDVRFFNRRSGKEVLFVFPNALNLSRPDVLPLVRALACCVRSRVRGYSGPTMMSKMRLHPRLTFGNRLWVAPKRLRMYPEEKKRLRNLPRKERANFLGEFLERYWDSDEIEVGFADQRLTANISDPSALEIASDLLMQEQAYIQESFLEYFKPVSSAEKKYNSEMVVLCHTDTKVTRHEFEPPLPKSKVRSNLVVYAKINAWPNLFSQILRKVINPFAEKLVASGLCSDWFFVRYRDDGPELRVRFFCVSTEAKVRVLALTERILDQMKARKDILRWSFQPYMPETVRYGVVYLQRFEESFYYDTRLYISTCIGTSLLDKLPLMTRGMITHAIVIAFYCSLRYSDVERARMFIETQCVRKDRVRYRSARRVEHEIRKGLLPEMSERLKSLPLDPSLGVLRHCSDQQFRDFLHMSANRWMDMWDRDGEITAYSISRRFLTHFFG